MSVQKLLLAALALTAAGCSGWDQRLAERDASRPPDLPRDMIDRSDGTYKGIASLAEANSPYCPERRRGTIDVGDGRLVFPYAPDALFIVPIQPDGTLRGQAGSASLDGRLADGRLAFTVTTPLCQSSYDMRWTL